MRDKNDKNPITYWSEAWEEKCMLMRYDGEPNPEFRERKCLKREAEHWKTAMAVQRKLPTKESRSKKESAHKPGNDYQNSNIHSEKEGMLVCQQSS